MPSLRFRMTLWVAGLSTSVLVACIVALNAYLLHRVTQQSKQTFRGFAAGLAAVVRGDVAETGPLPGPARDLLDRHLAFADPAGSLSAGVFSSSGEPVYRSKGFPLSVLDLEWHQERTQLRVLEVRSGAWIGDWFSDWRLVYRSVEGDWVVYVVDSYRFELAERVVEGSIAALLGALLLSLPAGYVLSRRILRPFHAVDEAARRIRSGDLSARVAVVEPVPEVNQLLLNLNETFAELESAFDRIRQFSADVAHELRTPLTVCRGNLEVCLATDRSPAEYQAVLAESIAELSRLSGMVRDLLLLASPGGAKQRARFAAVDLRGVVRDTVERLSLLASDAQVKIGLSMDRVDAAWGDAALLERALYNVLHNAIRHAPPDSVVGVRVHRVGAGTAIEVTDSGPGIPADQQERIFERFYRLDPHRESGSGLGLSMAKWITELHGGRIEVQSVPGAGALFRFVLPRPPHPTQAGTG